MSRLKLVVPYAMVALLPFKSVSAENWTTIPQDKQQTTDSVIPNFNTMHLPETYTPYMEEKIDKFISLFIKNEDKARNNINRNKKKLGYSKSVKQELGKKTPIPHCVASQLHMVNNTLKELGDTIQLLDKYYGCSTIAAATKKKHPDCVFYGPVYKTQQQYNTAFANFVKAKHKQLDKLSTEEQQILKIEFNKKARLLSDIKPGSLMIINNMGHMIMHCGIGYKDTAGNFISDSTGTPIFAGFNKEQIGDFSYINTNRVFIIDLEKILYSEYTKELQNILSKDTTDLIKYIETKHPTLNINLYNMHIEELRNIATCIYFNMSENLISNSLYSTNPFYITYNEPYKKDSSFDTKALQGQQTIKQQNNVNDVELTTNSHGNNIPTTTTSPAVFAAISETKRKKSQR